MTGQPLSQLVTGISPLGKALDGTPAKRPARAKAAPKEVVGTSFECHCGQRFVDLREAWIHVRAEYAEARRGISNLRRSNGHRVVAECGTSGGYSRHRSKGEPSCEACKAAERARRRQYYAANRDACNAKGKEYRSDHRDELNAKGRQRRASDPSVRERDKLRKRETRARQRPE